MQLCIFAEASIFFFDTISSKVMLYMTYMLCSKNCLWRFHALIVFMIIIIIINNNNNITIIIIILFNFGETKIT